MFGRDRGSTLAARSRGRAARVDFGDQFGDAEPSASSVVHSVRLYWDQAHFP
jgi:hypothetical protein